MTTASGTAERSCILTRAVKPKGQMIRFVVGPESRLVADLAENLPGRGMWLSASKLLLAEAIARRSFHKAAKMQVAVPEGFAETLETLWRRRLLDLASLARKAGQLISGFDKVSEALEKGRVLVLLQAQDAGEDGLKKLAKSGIPSFRGFDRAALSALMGKENAVHVAVMEGSAGAFFLRELRRFALFMDETGL
ncbi:MAG: RNA-binding protein [Alphaproteobacteria bacterium]